MKRITAVLIALVFIIQTSQNCFAAFETFNLGVKPMALVDTFSVLGDEPIGMIYNPAQTVQMKYSALSTAFSKPNVGWGESDVNIYSAYYVHPMSDMAFGMGISYLGTNLNYAETIGTINFAVKYREIYDTPLSVAWGINGKILSMKRGDPAKPWDPALKEMTLTRQTADVGLWLEYGSIVGGFSVANIVPADFGVVVKSEIPQETRIGAGIRNILLGEKFKVTPSVEYTSRSGFSTLSGGLNFYLLKMLDFQIGASQDNLGFGMTVWMPRPEDREDEYNKSTMRIDVSWLYPVSGIDTAGSPQIGLVFYF